MANVNMYTAGKKPVVELTGINNLGTEDIKSVKMATGVTELMNGMGVVVNEVTEEASLPIDTGAKVWLHASVEKLYNGEGRNEFSITDTTKGFLARVYRLRDGQTFETNACFWDGTTYANLTAVKTAMASATLYAIPSTSGLWEITATLPTTVEGTSVAPTIYCTVKAIVTAPNNEAVAELVVKIA